MSLTFKIENMTLYVGPMPASMPQVGAYYGELHHERVVYPIACVWGNSEEEVRAKLLARAEQQLKAREVMRAGGTEALAAFLKQR